MRKVFFFFEKKMIKNDLFCYSLLKIYVFVFFFEFEDRSNLMKGRSWEGEGYKSMEGGRIWYGR